jgi:hypothetical protein
MSALILSATHYGKRLLGKGKFSPVVAGSTGCWELNVTDCVKASERFRGWPWEPGERTDTVRNPLRQAVTW